MCGIVGAIAERNIVPVLMEGLRRLEYRGYDSAGIAVVQSSGELALQRTIGKVTALEDRLARETLAGRLGVAIPAGQLTAASRKPTPTRMSPAIASP
jgi:glucosamine--fructose-6-phosphate aminotransferase (isomerizing)